MAILSEADRFELWAESMRDRDFGPIPLTKPELRASIDAVDAWVDSNAVAFNQAIPQPARANLTTKQKAALLMFIVARRHKVAS